MSEDNSLQAFVQSILSLPDQPLFKYTVTPPQVFTSTGTDNPVSLFISVFNRRANGFVAVKEIIFGISIGDNQNDLTDDPADVQPQSNQSTWGIQKQTYVSSPLIFIVTPNSGTTGLDPNTSISFELTGINVNVEGGAAFFIAEMTGGQTRQETLTINKVSPSLLINYFQANPPSIEPGGQATLSWETSGASHCTIDQLANSTCSPPVPPPDPLPLNGQLQVCPLLTTIYTLTAYDHDGGHVQAQAGVSVTGAQIISFIANPTTIDCFSPTATLEWQVVNAGPLQLDPGAIDVTGKNSYPVNPTADTTYTLTAHGSAGQPVSAQATVYIEPATVTSFDYAPAEVFRGQPFTLQWETQHANSCSIDQGIGTVEPAPGGSVPATLQDTTTYTLSATGLGQPTTQQTTVTPQPAEWQQAGEGLPNLFIPALAVYQDQLWCIDLYNQWVFSSADGVTWTPVTVTNPWSQSVVPSSVVVFNNKMWIITSSYDPTTPVWYSEDGANWINPSQSGQSPFPHRFQMGNIVFNNQLWIIGGYDGSNYLNDAWQSADGSNWVQALAQAPWSPRGLPSLAIFNDELWMCGGQNDGGTVAEAWHTRDGVTWVQATAPWPARCAPGLQSINDKLYLISGSDINGMNPLNDMWAMDANLNWSQLPYGSPATAWVGGGVALFNWRIWLAASKQGMWVYNP